MKINNSTLSTILGLIVAIGNAWLNVDWSNFEFNIRHIAPLVVSALVAIGGYMTSINIKNDESKFKGY